MPLLIPNTLANDQLADGDQLQQNFATIQDYCNQEVVRRDGQVAMQQPLLLSGNPTENGHASNKAYVDSGVAGVKGWADQINAAMVAGDNALNNRVGAVEGRVGALEGRMASVEGVDNVQNSRLAWLRTRTRGQTTGGVTGTKGGVGTNGSGDYTVDFVTPFPGGVPTAVAPVVFDTGLGIWLCVSFTNNVGFTGRAFTVSNGSVVPAANLPVFNVMYTAWGFMDSGYP